MTNEVFANTREISCKKADGKGLCCFPDVCMTPPTTPATPAGVPIPYPNTAFSKDTANGSKTVKISDKEIMLKNKSYFKTSTGDEAGCATPAKKGIITGKIKGKLYFTSWSMDVKAEGKNVVRHLDIATHNHASMPGNTPIWPYLDTLSLSEPTHPCVNDQIKEMQACQEYQPYGDKDPCDGISLPPSPPTKPDDISKNDFEKSEEYKRYKSMRHAFYAKAAHDSAQHDCLNARRCQLVPFTPTNNQPKCCDGKRQTGHHIVEASACYDKGRGGSDSNPLKDCAIYNQRKAPSICVEGTDHGTGTHGLMHTCQSASALTNPAADLPLNKGGTYNVDHATTYSDARDNGIACISEVFPESGCNEECLKKQMDAYHIDECKMKENTKLKAVATTKHPDIEAGCKYVQKNKG